MARASVNPPYFQTETLPCRARVWCAAPSPASRKKGHGAASLSLCVAWPLRHAPGGAPTYFLKALLKAASDS
jgi:hypothetical protein